MRVYILENQSYKVQKILSWLAEKTCVDEVSLIKNSELFLELAKREPPDVAFIRLGENDIPGLGIGEKLNKMEHKVQIVFISDNKENAISAFEVGVLGYLLSPVDRTKFEKCFNSISKTIAL